MIANMRCLAWLALASTILSVSLASLTQRDKQQIVDVHNKHRSRVNPPASNMKKLVWDEDMAKVAQAWADHCVFEHNTTGGVGQCLYGYSNLDNILVMGVDAWDSEKKDYIYQNNTCNPGKVCGHYTQVVWAKSERMGCGLSGRLCPMGMYMVVCNYLPPGNFYGEFPYKSGPSCSACEPGYICQNNLCAKPKRKRKRPKNKHRPPSSPRPFPRWGPRPQPPPHDFDPRTHEGIPFSGRPPFDNEMKIKIDMKVTFAFA